MRNFTLLLKKYSVPFIFCAIGIALIIISLVTEQPKEFILASVIILICSIFLFLTVSGIVSNKFTNMIGGVSLVLSGYAFYSAWSSVGSSITHNEDYALMKGLAIRNLKDVQKAQKEYEKKYNVFASDWPTLIDFIGKDSIADIERKGSVPNRKITEKERDYLIQFGLYKKGGAIDNKMKPLEAYYLSKSDDCPEDLITFKRDTIMVNFLETTFTKNKGYLTERVQNNYGKFDVNKLQYIPFTNNKIAWNIDTSMTISGTDTICYFRLEGILPIPDQEGAKAKEIMSLGNLSEFNLSGSWEDEDIKQKLQLPKSNLKSIYSVEKEVERKVKAEVTAKVDKDKTPTQKKEKEKEKIKEELPELKRKGESKNPAVKSKTRVEFEKIFSNERRKRIDTDLNPDEGTFTFRGKLYSTEMATLN